MNFPKFVQECFPNQVTLPVSLKIKTLYRDTNNDQVYITPQAMGRKMILQNPNSINYSLPCNYLNAKKNRVKNFKTKKGLMVLFKLILHFN